MCWYSTDAHRSAHLEINLFHPTQKQNARSLPDWVFSPSSSLSSTTWLSRAICKFLILCARDIFKTSKLKERIESKRQTGFRCFLRCPCSPSCFGFNRRPAPVQMVPGHTPYGGTRREAVDPGSTAANAQPWPRCWRSHRGSSDVRGKPLTVL